jgi:hypothetical protein
VQLQLWRLSTLHHLSMTDVCMDVKMNTLPVILSAIELAA